MTESCSPGAGRRPEVALALQGGGAHGAFTWGVLDRLLQDGLQVDAVCGVSSGAILGTPLVQGLVRGGTDGTRKEMRRLWRRVAQAPLLSPLQNGPRERWRFGWDLSSSLLWQGWEMAMRLFSPAQLNPFGHNPLRLLLSDLLESGLLTHPAAPRLTAALPDLPISSKFNGEAEFLSILFEADRAAVAITRPALRPPALRPVGRPAQRAAADRAI